MKLLLSRDPAQRPEIEDILRHPWIANGFKFNRRDPLKEGQASLVSCGAAPPSRTKVQVQQIWRELKTLFPNDVKVRTLRSGEVLFR